MHERSRTLASSTLLRTAPPLRRVRSTLLCSGLVELRARGLLDDYLRVLDPAAAPTLLEAVAANLFVRELPQHTTPKSLRYRVAWV